MSAPSAPQVVLTGQDTYQSWAWAVEAGLRALGLWAYSGAPAAEVIACPVPANAAAITADETRNIVTILHRIVER